MLLEVVNFLFFRLVQMCNENYRDVIGYSVRHTLYYNMSRDILYSEFIREGRYNKQKNRCISPLYIYVSLCIYIHVFLYI